jgi:hypothetical protein
MKLRKLICYSIISMILFISCSNKKNNKIKLVQESLLEFKNAQDSLILKYDALTIIDTPINKYTFQLQKEFIDEKRLLAFSGDISDIYKKDGVYVLQVIHGIVYDEYIVHVILDSIQFENIKQHILTKKYPQGCFILRVSKIIPLSPAIQLEYTPGEPGDENNEGTDPYISLGEFGEERIWVFKTTLVDYHLR